MKKLPKIVLSVLGALIFIWGLTDGIKLFIDHTANQISDDAQVEQYIIPINVHATGYIDKVLFMEHKHVKKGDTLLILDSREYNIQLKQAQANLQDAQAGSKGVEATVNRTTTGTEVYDASISEIEVRLHSSTRLPAEDGTERCFWLALQCLLY